MCSRGTKATLISTRQMGGDNVVDGRINMILEQVEYFYFRVHALIL